MTFKLNGPSPLTCSIAVTTAEATTCSEKPNSITLSGSELVLSWFEPDSVMEFGFKQPGTAHFVPGAPASRSRPSTPPSMQPATRPARLVRMSRHTPATEEHTLPQVVTPSSRHSGIYSHPQNRKYIISIALSSKEDRATATVNTHIKFREVCTCSF